MDAAGIRRDDAPASERGGVVIRVGEFHCEDAGLRVDAAGADGASIQEDEVFGIHGRVGAFVLLAAALMLTVSLPVPDRFEGVSQAGHQIVNVYLRPERYYEVRSEE